MPVRPPVRLGKLNKTLINGYWDREHCRSTKAKRWKNWELSSLMYPNRHLGQMPVRLPEKARKGH